MHTGRGMNIVILHERNPVMIIFIIVPHAESIKKKKMIIWGGGTHEVYRSELVTVL